MFFFIQACKKEPEVSESAEETREERDARMAWWREAKFGMFIHWGLYAIPAGIWKGDRIPGVGEWIMFKGKIPVSEYEPLVEQFNPVQFKAKEWVQIAKDAGMKYIVITSKHHDGFCLFNSKLTDYDIKRTPFKRDILKELSRECHLQGIKICWYHSILDWHHPDYLPRGKESPRPWDTRPTENVNFDRYIEYMKGQLKELLTNYGEIGIMWFDGGWEHTPRELHSEKVVQLVRRLQPNIIINDRIGIPQDYDTPEQYIPATGIPGRDWETCMTMNDTWGFKSYDHSWKSVEDLIHKLVDSVSKGGNFLLNVGPTAKGKIPEPSVERLAAIGQWLKINGHSIYGTSASPFRRLDWGCCTVKPRCLFLHVFEWPQEELQVPGLMNEIKKAYLLSDAKKTQLSVSRSEDTVLITLPEQAPDPIDSVVVVEIEGEPEVINIPIQQSDDGTIRLRAFDACINAEKVSGISSARYESGEGKDNIGYWTNPKDWVSWDFEVSQPGEFSIEISYACDKGFGGSEYIIAVGEQELSGKVEETGSWINFVIKNIGNVRLPEARKYTLSVKPQTMPGEAVMNLKSVTLKPFKK